MIAVEPGGDAGDFSAMLAFEDARAHARWAGKRLPLEWEWQYAAQGTDGRMFPWGNAWDTAAVPASCQGRDLPALAAIDAHPNGARPYGVEDMVANVWLMAPSKDRAGTPGFRCVVDAG